jgi:hypothetical protein
MFSQRHRLRHVAAQWLLAWLLALAAGFVNACVLEPAARHGIASTGQDQHATATLHDGQEEPHGHPSHDPGKAPCAKFCDEPTVSAQLFKQQTDPLTGTWLATAPIHAPFVETMPPQAVVALDTRRDSRPPTIPILIAFLRLTL